MRQVAEAESVITQLVFEHSLRIRIRGDGLGKDSSVPSGSTQDTSNSTLAAEESTSTSGDITPAEAEVEEELLKETEDAARVETEKPKTAHLIGRINSLVTTDLMDVVYLQNMLRLRTWCRS